MFVMVRNVWVDVIVRPAAEEVHVVDPADESVREQWFAQRDVHASRTTLPLEQIARDIVVLTGDPTARVRPQLGDYRYELRELAW
jgi:hypothetical protein